jgi:hydroxymethylpyrimidine/phosphomethylpyrimidine kinase
VVTGGHLENPADLLSVISTNREIEHKFFPNERVESKATHGTGCAFSTSIACSLALGRGLEESVKAAQEFVRSAIREAYPIGRGIGPMNHLYRAKS